MNEELKKNLKMIFERLVRPVCLKAVLDPEQPASVEMGSFVKAVAQLSPWIELQLLERGEDSEADGVLGHRTSSLYRAVRGKRLSGSSLSGSSERKGD